MAGRLCVFKKEDGFTPCRFHGKKCCLDCSELDYNGGDCGGCRTIMDMVINECERADEELDWEEEVK